MENTVSRFKFLAVLCVILFFYAIAVSAGENTTLRNTIPFPQQQEVRGTVNDVNGKPFPGATIMVKGSFNGTISDLDGNFSIQTAATDILVISYMGYKTLEVPVKDGDEINVTLEEDLTALDEVEINAGYYSVTEKERTGNISRITSEVIEKQPVSNPLAAMQGRMTGVQITQTTGVPGGDFDIQIRGRNSLRNDGNDPLFVIDGVPFTANPITASQVVGANLQSHPLNSMNPSDIESIEVLKDADATAIYGSRGANGVVLITTKRGKSGDTKFSVDLNHGFGEVANFMDLLNTEQYLEMRREAFANDGAEPNTTKAPDLLTWDTNRNTDWQEKLIGGTAEISNLQTAISGGNENTTFRIGGGHRRETTVFRGDSGHGKTSGNLNVNHWSKDQKFNGSFSANYIVEKSNLPSTGFVITALELPPNAPPLYNDDGSLNWEDSTWENPLAALEEKYDSNISNLITNGNLSYGISPNFKVRSSFGYNSMEARETQVTPQTSFDPGTSTNKRETTVNNSGISTWIAEPQLEYYGILGKSVINAILGGTIQETFNTRQIIQAKGFTSDALMENLGAATDFHIFASEKTEYRYRALFGRLNYKFDDKYLINLTARRDGSSRFGPGNQYANFGAVGAAWIFSEEEFIQNAIPFLNFGKLRGSYGITGSDQIGDYQFMDLWRTSFFPYYNNSGLEPSRLVNRNFAWEVNRKVEFGLEVSVLEDRIFLGTSYYLNRSSNQLVGLPLPGITGFSSVQFNMPAIVENKGLEIELRTRNLDFRNFSWNTTLNLSFNRNELVSYPDLENSPFASTYSVGEPLSIIKSRRYAGVNPETGVYEFEDINGDGVVNIPGDLVELGHLDPKFHGGLGNSLEYKNWELAMFFQFSKQKGRAYYTMHPPGYQRNQPVHRMDRWQQAGDQSDVQRFTQTFGPAYFAYNYANSSDYTLVDASYLRLKNLVISYSLPFSEPHGIKSRISIQGQNLWTLTNYPGMDPETANRTTLPPLRFLTAGIQLTL